MTLAAVEVWRMPIFLSYAWYDHTAVQEYTHTHNVVGIPTYVSPLGVTVDDGHEPR